MKLLALLTTVITFAAISTISSCGDESLTTIEVTDTEPTVLVIPAPPLFPDPPATPTPGKAPKSKPVPCPHND